MRLGSLFDGIGGWLISAVKFGVTPVWASEIEPFAIAVTKAHFPNVKHLGDVVDIDGSKIEPVDIITMGSPCQDISVAGRREGLKGERSGLFHEGIRIVREMQEATGGKFPKYIVFENVPGIFSSNKGNDFRVVLGEIGEAEIPIPDNGKWASAGLVELPKCEIAWRVLDAQFFGVPQRRRRIFLIASLGRRCAGQILFESESVHRDSATSGTTKEGDSSETEGSARVAIYDMTHANEVIRSVPDGRIPTLNARMGTGGNQVPLVFALQSFGEYKESGCVSALKQRDYKDATDLVLQKFVRRLTPTECERLQGLEDGYTDVLCNNKPASNASRYKALGNGMAQPCANYIMERVVSALKKEAK